ncbi:MAG: hypothetical protein TREMPRED_003517, partial [Tremellales sp. Tagirdzhanova-0007]
ADGEVLKYNARLVAKDSHRYGKRKVIRAERTCQRVDLTIGRPAMDGVWAIDRPVKRAGLEAAVDKLGEQKGMNGSSIA